MCDIIPIADYEQRRHEIHLDLILLYGRAYGGEIIAMTDTTRESVILAYIHMSRAYINLLLSVQQLLQPYPLQKKDID